MGKKIPLLISTLSMVAGSLAPIAAWADEPTRTTWTYEEMAALNVEYEKEVAENCDTYDPMCSDSYIYTKTGDIYSALQHYRERGLTITAVNPSSQTVKVAYNSGLLSLGFSKQLTVKDLYMYQAEIGYYQWGFDSAFDNHDTETLAHFRALFVKNDADPSDIWFPPDTEIELAVPELAPVDSWGSAAENFSPKPLTPTKYRSSINVNYRMSDPASSWGDYFDFSDCVGHLAKDTECQVRYSASGTIYVPVEVSHATADLGTNSGSASGLETTTLTDSEDGGSEGSTTPASSENNSSKDPLATLTSSESSNPESPTATFTPMNTSDVSTSANAATTPDTGDATAQQEGSTEFPWWLGMVFVIGATTLAWLFWPKAKKITKKS